jgi:hypothetical protein
LRDTGSVLVFVREVYAPVGIGQVGIGRIGGKWRIEDLYIVINIVIEFTATQEALLTDSIIARSMAMEMDIAQVMKTVSLDTTAITMAAIDPLMNMGMNKK